MPIGTLLLILRLLLIASLYVFVAWALLTLWRDLKRQTEMISFVQIPPLALLWVEQGESWRFFKPEVSIGRDPACDSTIDDKTVSTQHARLSFHHNQWWVEDAGSTNGTFLNGERVAAPLVVTSGDELRCGQVALAIQIGDLSGNGPRSQSLPDML